MSGDQVMHSAQGPFDSETNIRITKQNTLGERPRLRRHHPAEYRSHKSLRIPSETYESLSPSSTMEQSSQWNEENLAIVEVEKVPVAEVIMDGSTGSQPIDSKKHVDAIAEIASEIETAAELDAQAATLEAMSIFPELQGEKDMENHVVETQEMTDFSTAAPKSPKSPRPVDFLIVGVHGIGAEPSVLAQNKKDLKEHLKFIQAHWFWELEFKTHVELIDWKSALLPRQAQAFHKILPHIERYKKLSSASSTASRGSDPQKGTLASSLGDPRQLLTDHVSDLLCFMTPYHGDFIIETVANNINHTVEALRSRSHGRFSKSKVILVGHSLGGIILYELLTGQRLRPGTPLENPPKLNFIPESLFMWGVPLGAFCVLHDPSFSIRPPNLPAGVRVFNIFHPCDPIGFRFEPLFFPNLESVPPPVRLPNWRTNGAKEYWQWERDFVHAKRALNQLWAETGTKFRAIFGGGNKETTGEKTSTSEIPLNEGAERPKLPSETESGVSWRAPRKCVAQRVNAEARYGTHDRKVLPGRATLLARQKTQGFNSPEVQELPTGRLSVKGSTSRSLQESAVGGEEVLPPWLGGKRKAATVVQLMKMLNIPEDDKSHVVEALITGREGDPVVDLQGIEPKPGSKEIISVEDIEILSEVEEGGGLELPVRLDFALQEEITERYISQLGTLQSHFNYWISRDAVFFMLKEITNFRPRLSYPDFLRILKYSEVHNPTLRITEMEPEDVPIEQSLNLDSQKTPTVTPLDTDRLEVFEEVAPKRMRTLKRAPIGQQQVETTGDGAEQGKFFFG